jgi:hypothetical protein
MLYVVIAQLGDLNRSSDGVSHYNSLPNRYHIKDICIVANLGLLEPHSTIPGSTSI